MLTTIYKAEQCTSSISSEDLESRAYKLPASVWLVAMERCTLLRLTLVCMSHSHEPTVSCCPLATARIVADGMVASSDLFL